MKDKNSINKILVIGALIFVGWCVAIIVTVRPELIGFNFWFALAFGIIAFALSLVSILKMKVSYNRNLTEINALPFIATVAYFAAAIVLNSIFIFRLYFGFRLILVALNFILLIAFVSYRLFTNNYASQVETLSEKLEEKTGDVKHISAKIAQVAAKISDADRKKRLLKLKETVDYSTNLTQPKVYEIQDEFLLELNKLEALVDGDCSADDFNGKMSRLESIWKSRNTVK